MKGAFPPSSMLVFLKPLAHSVWRYLPTAVDPVKLKCRIAECLVSTSPISAVRAALDVTTLKTPGGPPARSNSFAIASAHSGVSGAGLHTTVLPAAIAAPTFLVTIAIGEFQGVIAATTPWGCRIVKILWLDFAAGIVSPPCLSRAASNQSRKSSPYRAVTKDSVNGFASSSVQIAARSSIFSRNKSAHLRIRDRRSRAVVLRNDWNAMLAASTAFTVSSLPRSATSIITLSSVGSTA